MAFMELDQQERRHEPFYDDVTREHEGLQAELFAPEWMGRHLEDRIIGECARHTEEMVKMLQTFGSM